MKEVWPKVIFIDWNGTLSNSKFWGHLESGSHPDHHIFEKVESSLFGSLKHLIKPWMRGGYSSEEIIDQIADFTGLATSKLMADFVESCKGMEIVSAKVMESIKKLRVNGSKVVVATDNMDSFSRWTVPHLRLSETFDETLNSHDLKALKGDFDENGKSLFFTQYFKTNSLLPSECGLIDDSEDKNGVIQHYGITYLRINGTQDFEDVLSNLAGSNLTRKK